MKKYKIHKEKPKELSEQEILKNRDFGRLIANYEKATKPLYRTPMYKDPKTFLVIVAIAAVCWLIASELDKEEEQKLPNQQDTVQTEKP